MERVPKDDRRAEDGARILPEEPVGVPAEARDPRRKDAEEAGWMSMVDRDPALFIKDSE